MENRKGSGAFFFLIAFFCAVFLFCFNTTGRASLSDIIEQNPVLHSVGFFNFADCGMIRHVETNGCIEKKVSDNWIAWKCDCSIPEPFAFHVGSGNSIQPFYSEQFHILRFRESNNKRDGPSFS